MQKLDVTEMSRKRSPNFTKQENRVLAELVQIYEEQIECKKTDHASNLGKLRAWQELSNDFNARLGGDPFRSATVLKSRYENIKKDIRRDLRKKHRGTNTDSQDTEINQLETSEDTSENSQSYEKNEDAEMDSVENVESETDIKEIIRVKLMTDDTMDEEDFEKYVTQSVKSESANQTYTQARPQKSSETTCWTNNSDPELMDLQKKCFLEEHKLKLKHMKEKHDLEMEIMRLDHKQRIKLLQQEHDTKMEMLELEKSEGPHSVLADDEFYDAVESGLDKMEEEQELREKLKTGQIPITPPPTSPAVQHRLWPEIDRKVKQQVKMARMGIGECGTGWQLFAEDGEMKMYRREEEIDGMVVDPLKAVHVVKGITGHELCHYFFNPKYRYDWETTLEQMTVLETIADDTLIFLQTHKRIWPASQRDVVFWSHIRRLPNDQDRDGPDIWTVVNNSTESQEHPVGANLGKCVRIFLTVCLLCQTRVDPPKDGAPITRDNVSCKITYCSVVNPGGWAPASVLRAVYKREYPKFLKRFTAYVINQTHNKPPMF